MEISDVRVFPVEGDEDRLKAYATITFDDSFIVRDLRVIKGNNGLFVAMPSKKRKDGTFRDIAHPLNSEMRTKIEEGVLKAYEDSQKGQSSDAPKEDPVEVNEESAEVNIEE